MEFTAYIAKQPAERRKLLTAIHDTIIRFDKKVKPVIAPMMRKEMINYMLLHVIPIYESTVIIQDIHHWLH